MFASSSGTRDLSAVKGFLYKSPVGESEFDGISRLMIFLILITCLLENVLYCYEKLAPNIKMNKVFFPVLTFISCLVEELRLVEISPLVIDFFI